MRTSEPSTATLMCSSGLLLDAFAKRWENAVCRAPATCGSQLASWILVSGHEKGTVLFFFKPVLSEEHYSPLFLFQIPLMVKQKWKVIDTQRSWHQTIKYCGYLSQSFVRSMSIKNVCVLQQSQPDIKWVENAKTLFKVRTHVASTIYAQVQHLIP